MLCFFLGGGEGGGRKLVNVIPMSIGSRSHFLVVKYWYRTQCCAALQRILRDILCNIVQYVFFTAAQQSFQSHLFCILQARYALITRSESMHGLS